VTAVPSAFFTFVLCRIVLYVTARIQLSREVDGRHEVEGRRTQSAGAGGSLQPSVDESLWDLNGVKLWRYCARILACSTDLPLPDTADEDIEQRTLLPPAEPDRGATTYLSIIQMLNRTRGSIVLWFTVAVFSRPLIVTCKAGKYVGVRVIGQHPWSG